MAFGTFNDPNALWCDDAIRNEMYLVVKLEIGQVLTRRIRQADMYYGPIEIAAR